MIGFRGSNAVNASPNCRAVARASDGGNVSWIADQVGDLGASDSSTYVILVGGVSIYDFRLRVAQSHLRADLTPSHWSHAALIMAPSRRITGSSQLLECSLEPWEGFRVPSTVNGLQIAPLRRYNDVTLYPNVAVMQIPVRSMGWRDASRGKKSVREQFADQRSVLDVSSLLLEWLGFVWCAGPAGNPLLTGHGIPAAAVIESLIGSTGYDVSPGIDTSASSPEAFWQTARWWQGYFSDLGIPQMHTRFHVDRNGQAPESAPKPSRRRSSTGQETRQQTGTLSMPRMLASDSRTAKWFGRDN